MQMPSVATSLATDFVNAITAAFVDEYGDMLGLPSLPAMDAMLTMRPYFWLRMCEITARVQYTAPSRLMAMTCCQSWSLCSHRGAALPATPALLTRMSMRPR